MLVDDWLTGCSNDEQITNDNKRSGDDEDGEERLLLSEIDEFIDLGEGFVFGCGFILFGWCARSAIPTSPYFNSNSMEVAMQRQRQNAMKRNEEREEVVFGFN